jgi:hypothetical protein
VQNASWSDSLIDRMIGAARLDVPTYEEIERDENATLQAFVVVVLVAAASGLGLLFVDGVGGLFGGIARAIFSWIIFAMVAYVVGTKLIPDPNTRTSVDELMRTTGFAQTPGLLSIFAFIPIVGWLVAIAVWIWTVVAVIVALRQALDTSTARAVGIALLSLLVILFISLIFAAIGLSVMAL